MAARRRGGRRPGAGRPRKPEAERHVEGVIVKLTKPQKVELAEAADEAGASLGAFIRGILLRFLARRRGR